MSFEDDLDFGKFGERLAYAIVSESPKTRAMIDCSNDSYFFDKDVDFLQLTDTGKINKYEVKTDRYMTGNMAFETRSNGNVGCLARTEADYIMYVYYRSRDVFLINATSLKRFTETRPERLKWSRMGDGAEGYLIKVSDLEAEGIAKRI